MANPTRRWSVWLQRLIPIVALAVFGIAIAFIVRVFGQYTFAEILAAISAIPRDDLALAAVLTAIAYLTLCTYDIMGLRYVGSKLPVRPAIFTAFTAFAFGNNIGLAAVAGSSVRLRLYGSFGLQPGQILRVIAFVTMTFWVGFLSIAGLSMMMAPVTLPEGYGISAGLSSTIGAVCLSLAALYIGLCRYFRRPVFIRGVTLHLPHPGLAITQAATAAIDWMLAAGVLYLLLPHEHIGYFPFLSIFISAQIVALVTNVPGGIGVLEALVIYFMSTDNEASPEILGGLLVYRLIYYIAPLIVAALLFLSHEIRERRSRKPVTA
jgi:glycosyltransferase 2 family protein